MARSASDSYIGSSDIDRVEIIIGGGSESLSDQHPLGSLLADHTYSLASERDG